MTTAVSLLTRGYFPRELPPPFSSADFGAYVAIPNQRAILPGQKTWTRCVSHNLARPGTLRRPLEIPNPIHHLKVAEAIEANWALLATHFRKSQLSVSLPRVRRTILDRAVVPRLTHRVLSRLRARRFIGARYFLRTDINQFYPSIYTHTIPWALHGKAHAKANIRNTPGDTIDKAFRDQQDGQTVGIPIGPDSSLIIAETILSAVDQQISALRLNGFRYVDDYEVGCQTLAEAEQALNELQSALAGMELSLNPRKTSIVEGPLSFEEEWVTELGRFPFRGKTSIGQLNDAIAFFGRAFELAKEHPQHAVLRYAIVMAQRWTFVSEGWRTFQALLYNAATADPGTLPVVIVLLEQHIKAGCAINKTAMSKLIEATIARHAPLAHGSEVAWAVWLSIQFDIPLSSLSVTLLGAMEDDVVALLTLDAGSRGRFSVKTLDVTRWTGLVNNPDVLHDEHWLLAYEANRKKWLSCPSVAVHPSFSILENAAISFYDVGISLTTFTGAAASIPGGGLGPGYV